jgi:hypothetical protein
MGILPRSREVRDAMGAFVATAMVKERAHAGRLRLGRVLNLNPRPEFEQEQLCRMSP